MKKLFVSYGVIVILWTFYRLFFHLPEWADELIAKPILWLTPLGVTGNLSFKLLYNQLKKTGSYNIIIGLIGGISYFTLFRIVTRQLSILVIPGLTVSALFLNIVIVSATGLIEEMVFRLVLFEQLSRTMDALSAVLLTTLLFVGIHLPIMLFSYHYTFVQIIWYSMILAVSSLVYTGVYLHKRSVGSAALTHAIWNLLGDVIR